MTSCHAVQVTSLGYSSDPLSLVSSAESIRQLREDKISREVNSPSAYAEVHSSTV